MAQSAKPISALVCSENSFLSQSGWFRTRQSGAATNADGKPVPWYTYSATHFLDARLAPKTLVFEYGSGNSTLWYAARARRVVACEHERVWANTIRRKLPGNAEVIHRAEDDDYAGEILRHDHRFDLIAIDGRKRNECARTCLEKLSDTGVIVWDNAERRDYEPGLEMLERRGFRRVDFFGMGPINAYAWLTSVLYRDSNCLGL